MMWPVLFKNVMVIKDKNSEELFQIEAEWKEMINTWSRLDPGPTKEYYWDNQWRKNGVFALHDNTRSMLTSWQENGHVFWEQYTEVLMGMGPHANNLLSTGSEMLTVGGSGWRVHNRCTMYSCYKFYINMKLFPTKLKKIKGGRAK